MFKGLRLLLYIILLNLVGYHSNAQQFATGEIYLRVKKNYSSKITNKNSFESIKKELPFLKTKTDKYKVSEKNVVKPFQSNKNSDLKNIIRIKFGENDDISSIIEELKADGYYDYVERVPLRTIISVPNDPNISSQWSLNKIGAYEAWSINPGNSNVIIAVIDNAIQTNHPDLLDNMVAGIDMSAENDTDPNPPNATFNHGTHVAGIVSAVCNNSIGIASPSNNKVKIMPIKATPDNGNPNGIYYGFEGITWAVENGAKVISLSWGGPGFSNAEQEVINFAHENNVIVVAAAGNENTSEPQFPAAYEHVISVASLDSTNVRSSFSSFGSTVDISAPGRAILSTLPFNTYGSFSGTSMATPLVSSCIGYLISCFPVLNNDQIEDLIKKTSLNIDVENPNMTGMLGSGIINLKNAVSCQTEGLIYTEIDILPGRYFCIGDTVNLNVTPISNANYQWFNNSQIMVGTQNSINVTQAGSYSLVINKGQCSRRVTAKSLILNTILSEAPVVNNIENFYCAGKDTLKSQLINCSFQPSYFQSYIGPTVGYDAYEQSGDDPNITFSGVPGLIDSLEVTIVWQKKDGGAFNTCGVADGGAVPFNEEIGFNLVSPEGIVIPLILEETFARGTVSAGLITQTFKTGAPKLVAGSNPVSGIFGPAISFDALIGEIPNGKWELQAVDNSFLDPLCVSGFSIKIYTNVTDEAPSISWWDKPSGGNLLSNNSELVLSDLMPGLKSYYAQSQCSGLCPSSRTKSEVWIEETPTIVGFPFEDILISESQAYEIANSSQMNFVKNSQNLYSVSGINSQNQAYSYLISNQPPKQSPVSLCGSVNYALLATGCDGMVKWSNGEVNAGILIQNLNNNYNVTAECLKTWDCSPPPPSNFSFFTSNQNTALSQVIFPFSEQKFNGKKITSTQLIKPESKVQYFGSESILLQPGFNVDKGNVFQASIKNCED